MQKRVNLLRTFGILFFFSQGPPGTLLPDTNPTIPVPFRKIDHFIKEKLPTFAFRQRFNENQQNLAEMAREITQGRPNVDPTQTERRPKVDRT